MLKTIKRLLGYEHIDEKAVEHSSKGEYTTTKRLKSGGHGQEALDYMNKNNIHYNITKTYANGVRIGNVPMHQKVKKRSGSNQSWFPASWNKENIKKQEGL